MYKNFFFMSEFPPNIIIVVKLSSLSIPSGRYQFAFLPKFLMVNCTFKHMIYLEFIQKNVI